jgi:hypothetical protein
MKNNKELTTFQQEFENKFIKEAEQSHETK